MIRFSQSLVRFLRRDCKSVHLSGKLEGVNFLQAKEIGGEIGIEYVEGGKEIWGR